MPYGPRISIPGWPDKFYGTVADTTPPTFTSAAAVNVNENNALVHALTADEFANYTIVGGADQALFAIVGTTLNLPAQDFENPADFDADGIYEVTVRATDTALNFDDQMITVTVFDLNESNWILDTGTWDDTKVWEDGALWID